MAPRAEGPGSAPLHVKYRPLSQGERIFDDPEQGRQWDILHARLERKQWDGMGLGPLADVLYFDLTMRLL